MTNFQELYAFVDRATRSRKYPEATAQTLRAALKLYEAELNEEEKKDIAKFRENFEQITQSVVKKNASRFSSSSLATYRGRALKVLGDYDRYSDPLKMNNWQPKLIVRAKKGASEAMKRTSAGSAQEEMPQTERETPVPDGMHKIELSLRENAKVVIIVPRDLKASENLTIKAILDSLVTK